MFSERFYLNSYFSLFHCWVKENALAIFCFGADLCLVCLDKLTVEVCPGMFITGLYEARLPDGGIHEM